MHAIARHRATDIETYRLNWPRGKFCENILLYINIYKNLYIGINIVVPFSSPISIHVRESFPSPTNEKGGVLRYWMKLNSFPYFIEKLAGVAWLVVNPPWCNCTTRQNQPVWDSPLYISLTCEPNLGCSYGLSNSANNQIFSFLHAWPNLHYT